MQIMEERLMSLENYLAIRNLAVKFADATTIALYDGLKALGNQMVLLRSAS